MLGYLRYTDSIIASFVTRWCHRFQRLTGKTNYWLGRIVLSCFVVSLALSLTTTPDFLLWPIFWFPFWVYPNVIKAIHDDKICAQADNDLLRSTSPARPVFKLATGPEESYSRPIIILLGLILFCHGISSWQVFPAIGWSWALWIGIFSYVANVTPLPPSRSLIKEWLASLFTQPVPVSVRT